VEQKNRSLIRDYLGHDRPDCETDTITPTHKRQLERLRAQTNLRQLRQDLYAQIDHLFSLPMARAGVPENVYQTLRSAAHPQEGDLLAHLNFYRTVIQPWSRCSTSAGILNRFLATWPGAEHPTEGRTRFGNIII
jgi:hypothetical protein